MKKQKVIIAMSGGVDSSVAAALLKRAGFNVVGIFMRFSAFPQNRCCSPESQERARLVASKLGMPFYVLNFEKEFKKRVIDYFIKESKAGRTPNPCVVCNKEIKFGLLLEKSLAMDTDFIATGHYARVCSSEKHNNFPLRGKFCSTLGLALPAKAGNHGRSPSEKFSSKHTLTLLRGRDKNKDQSYFLWQLNQKQLKHILFPVGDYTKVQVRDLAKRFKLPVLGIPESQEVCFIPTTINDFLAKHIKQKSGPIKCALPQSAQVLVHSAGVHRHQGLAFYTIGQRKGIGLSGGPYWVLDKDLKKNILIVTQNEKDLLKKELVFKNENWLSGKAPEFPLQIRAKIRSGHKLALATLYKNRLVFSHPQKAITPGQSVVFFRGQELLGGGIIC